MKNNVIRTLNSVAMAVLVIANIGFAFFFVKGFLYLRYVLALLGIVVLVLFLAERISSSRFVRAVAMTMKQERGEFKPDPDVYDACVTQQSTPKENVAQEKVAYQEKSIEELTQALKEAIDSRNVDLAKRIAGQLDALEEAKKVAEANKATDAELRELAKKFGLEK